MEGTFAPPKQFVPGSNPADAWGKWKKRFGTYMEAANLTTKPEKRKVAILLHVVGEEAQALSDTFEIPDVDKTLENYISRFDEYYIPKRNVTFERRKFLSAKQAEHQSIDDFVTELKKFAQTCEYGTLTEDFIKDQLVGGILDEAVKERLLRTADLNLQKAVEICRASAASKTHIKSFLSPEQTVDVVRKKSTFRKDACTSQPQLRYGSRPKTPPQRKCGNCGKAHPPRSCPAFGKSCRRCGKLNHFARLCRSSFRVHQLEEAEVQQRESLFLGSLSLQNANIQVATQTLSVELQVHGMPVSFRLDTGAQANVIPERIVRQLKPKPTVRPTSIRLTTYTEEAIELMGQCHLNCTFKNRKVLLPFLVTKKAYDPLLGMKTCMQDLHLIEQVQAINATKTPEGTSKQLIELFKDVFTGIGQLPGEYHIELDPAASPKVTPARKVPFALQPKLKEELERMEAMGIVEKVTFPTQWVHPLVIVHKPNGSLRICLDPQELNAAMRTPHYKLPTLEDITSKLSGATVFTVLDCSSAFLQKKLDKESSRLCTFATPFGRYCFKRLPYGIKAAPEVFQKEISELLEREQQAEPFMDDILIWGKTQQDHDKQLEKVLELARQVGLRFSSQKMQLARPSVRYLGHTLSKEGIQPSKERINAIVNMPKPEDRLSLQRWLGMVNYLSKFLPNLSSDVSPLRQLLHRNTIWEWTPLHDDIVSTVNEKLTKTPALTFYDYDKTTVIAVDASPLGLGAVLMQDGRPISYASTTLTEPQTRYAQIEKELSAVVYGCERFQQYVYGKHFFVETDHKPLIAMSKKPLIALTPRIQRLFLRLQRYNYQLVYKPGKEMFIADTLSRAPCKDKQLTSEEEDIQVLMLLQQYRDRDLNLENIRQEIGKDPVLQKLRAVCETGWPDNYQQVLPELSVYWKDKHELQICDNLIVKGKQIVIPRALQENMLQRLHESHQGIANTLARARQAIYWPGMTQQIKDRIASCTVCQNLQNVNPREPPMIHPVPSEPWVKVGIDFFDFKGSKFIEVVDYYSKYIEVQRLTDLRGETVIAAIKSIFARHGIPTTIATDGGPPFNSRSFQQFREAWMFQHSITSPLHPQSNGQVERAIQTIKKSFQKVLLDSKDPYLALLTWRTTPLLSGFTPSSLLMGRELRTLLPTLTTTESFAPEAFHRHPNATSCRGVLPSFKGGEEVWYRTESKFPKWKPAVIVAQRTEPRSYTMSTDHGTRVTRNRRHIRPRAAPSMEIADRSLPESPQVTTRSGRRVVPPRRLTDYVV